MTELRLLKVYKVSVKVVAVADSYDGGGSDNPATAVTETLYEYVGKPRIFVLPLSVGDIGGCGLLDHRKLLNTDCWFRGKY